MEELKIIKALKTFSKKEWKEFEKFAASPYFNNGRNYLPILKELKIFYPEFDSVKLTSEYLYSKLYPGKKHNKNVIKTTLSGLYKMVERFLIQENFKKRDETKLALLIRGLSDKGLNSDVENKILKAEREDSIKSKSFRDYFKHDIVHEEIYDHYYLNDHRTKLGILRERYNVFALKHLLLELIATEKESITQRNFLKHNFYESTIGRVLSGIDFKAIIDELEKDDPGDTLVLLIYYNILSSYKFIDVDSYYYKT